MMGENIKSILLQEIKFYNLHGLTAKMLWNKHETFLKYNYNFLVAVAHYKICASYVREKKAVLTERVDGYVAHTYAQEFCV